MLVTALLLLHFAYETLISGEIKIKVEFEADLEYLIVEWQLSINPCEFMPERCQVPIASQNRSLH